MRLYIRVDASAETGAGHIMRCIAVAQAWQQSGNTGKFITDCTNELLLDLISSCGFGKVSTGIKNSFDNNSDLVLQSIQNPEQDWILLDGYDFGIETQKKLKGSGARLLVMDDHVNRNEYSCSVILNQNPGFTPDDYAGFDVGYYLMGTEYILLRRQVVDAFKSREIRSPCTRILVTLGASVSVEDINRVLGYLENLQTPLEVRIVSGTFFDEAAVNPGSVQKGFCRCEFVNASANLSRDMLWADLAITGAGGTAWELCYLGTPALAIVLSENQKPNADFLESSGVMMNLGSFEDMDKGSFIKSFEFLTTSPEVRTTMSEKGRSLVDGKGAERVVKYMTGTIG